MAEPTTVRALLLEGRHRLGGDADGAALEAELLLLHLIDRPRSWLRGHPEAELGPTLCAQYRTLIARRAAGEPIAYLTGQRGFWSLDLHVAPGVLIPRPETEQLVELALARLPTDRPSRLADLGTGSGAIALAVASERPLCRVVATDRSEAALAIARRNAAQLGLERVDFYQGHWCEPLNGHFDLIVSNPPYIRTDDPHLDQGDLRHEPRDALASGADGLDAIRTLLACTPRHLLPGGWLLLEHGYDQGPALRRLLEQHGFAEITTWRDLAGHERISGGVV